MDIKSQISNINPATALAPKRSNAKIIILVILLAGTSFALGGAFAFSLINTDTELEVIDQPATTITYDELTELNPQFAFYGKSAVCRERFGYIHAFGDAVINKQPRIDILTFNNEVIGFFSLWPFSQGWYSYADQQEGEPIAIGDDEFYTKTIYLKTPPTIEDCTSAQN